MRKARVAAAAVGALVGLTAREVPLRLAAAMMLPGESECGDASALDCIFELLPDLVGGLVRLFWTVVLIEAVVFVLGFVATIVGWRRRDWVGIVLVAAGVALMVPAVWLAMSVALIAVQ